MNTARNLSGVAVLFALVAGCATRGPTIQSQIPEFSPNFDPARYVLVEDESNRVYYSKTLIEHWQHPSRFDEDAFERRTLANGDLVYVPRRNSLDRTTAQENVPHTWIPSGALPGENSYLIAPLAVQHR